MITNNISTLKIHKLTQEQYERELNAGRIDENALYLTPDEVGDVVDLASDQTITGSKIFKKGIVIGENGVQLSYDAEEGAMRFSFLTAATVEEETDEEI